MSSLAVKYRPEILDDVVEQDAIKTILKQQLAEKSFQHAYLFCGPAGTGKTTIARILANAINRQKGSPIEIDAASNNGVDDVREIIDNARRRSLDSEYKVYILDEVQMLSTGAFNALLKIFEEPPANTIFMMCTTDPNRIPGTILSRVQRYDFSKIPLKSIVERLKYIMQAEKYDLCGTDPAEVGDPPDYDYDEDALEYIAKIAEGGMRDAITLLEKCIAYNNQVTTESVITALGTVNYLFYFDLLYSLTTNTPLAAIKALETVYYEGKDLKQFLKQFQYFVLDVCKYKLFGSFEYTTIPRLAEYQQKLDDEEMQDCLDILEMLRSLNNSIKWETNVKAIAETSIMLFCLGGEQ